MFPTPTSTHVCVLHSLLRSPSRASAAAIGQRYVLSGPSPALQLLGIDALAQMPCDWAIAILEEAACDPSQAYDVRHQAIVKLQDLLNTAVRGGYPAVTPGQCHRWAGAADRELNRPQIQEGPDENPAVEELCSHLSQAVADGYLGRLPDF
jgi:hypothetical protein